MKNLGSKYPKVEILWADAAHISEGTHNEEEVRGFSLAEASTIGHLVAEDEEAVTLVMTHFYHQHLPAQYVVEEGLRWVWLVPRSCIREMYELKRGRKRL